MLKLQSKWLNPSYYKQYKYFYSKALNNLQIFFTVLLFAIFVVAFAHDCVRGSDNKPNCTTDPVGKYRHFHNPTVYWECVANKRRTYLKSCEDFKLFDGKLNMCVNRGEWHWRPHCP